MNKNLHPDLTGEPCNFTWWGFCMILYDVNRMKMCHFYKNVSMKALPLLHRYIFTDANEIEK